MLLIVGLAAFGGWLYWQHYSKTQSEAVSEQMDKMLATAVGGGTPDAKDVDALPKGEMVPLPHAGNLPHRVLAFNVRTARADWQAMQHPFYDFMIEQQHPDLHLQPQPQPEPIAQEARCALAA